MLRYTFFLIGAVFVCSCGSNSYKDSVVNKLSNSAPTTLGDGQFRASMSAPEFYGRIEGQTSTGAVYPGGYIAADPISFLAGIAVHAAVQGGADKSKRSKDQEQADKVLSPHSGHLDQIKADSASWVGFSVRHGDLRAEIVELSDTAITHHIEPNFYLAQNRSSLTLQMLFTEKNLPVDNEGLNASKNKKKPQKKSGSENKKFAVEIVSLVGDSAKKDSYWAEGDGKNLKERVRLMQEDAIKLFLVQASSPLSQSAETVRFNDGGSKRIERGVILEADCEKIIFVTLNNSIKKVPAWKDPSVVCNH
jgi:hypothetical protein